MPRLEVLLYFFIILTFSNRTNVVGRDNSTLRRADATKLEEVVAKRNGGLIALPSENFYKNLKAYGIMFDVYAMKKLTIIELNFFAQESNKTVYYHAYTVKGSYVTSKTNIQVWDLIATGMVSIRGLDEPTPLKNMTPVVIEKEETQGFYLTLTSEDMLYKMTEKSIGDLLVWNEDLYVTVGSGVGSYPLGHNFYEPRLWCGSLRYSITIETSTNKPSSKMSTSPSVVSSFRPSFLPSYRPSLLPTPLATFPLREVSFDQLFILFGLGVDFLNGESDDTFTKQLQQSNCFRVPFSEIDPDVQISLKISDEYQRHDNTLMVDTEVTAKYRAVNEVDIDSHLQGIQDCIVLNSPNILFELQKNSRSSYFQHVSQIFSLAPPKNFNSYEHIYKNQTMSLSGPYITRTMNDESKHYFERVFRQFLATSLTKINPSTKVLSVVVTHQFFNLPNDGRIPFINFYVFIYGLFLPPKFDFPSAVKSIIDENSQILRRELLDSQLTMFQAIDNIKMSHTENIYSVSSNEKSTFDSIFKFLQSSVGYVVIGGIAFIMLLILVVCFRSYCCKSDNVAPVSYRTLPTLIPSSTMGYQGRSSSTMGYQGRSSSSVDCANRRSLSTVLSSNDKSVVPASTIRYQSRSSSMVGHTGGRSSSSVGYVGRNSLPTTLSSNGQPVIPPYYDKRQSFR